MTGNLLHNTGGPCSRVRVEPVRESFLEKKRISENLGIYCLDLPDDEYDLEAWVLRIAAEEGLTGWDEIFRNVSLPLEKLMAITVRDPPAVRTGPQRPLLETALVLSRSNQHCYLPGGPEIFTRSRLERCIELFRIKNDNFYELD